MNKSLVSIILGSKSDWPVMEHAAKILEKFGISYEAHVFSAHRTPEALEDYLKTLENKDTEIVIAAAGCAAHLPGVIASKVVLPVIGVPMLASALSGMDALFSIVQMPGGIPVATMAIGKAGAINSALYAISILSVKWPEYRKKIEDYRKEQAKNILADNLIMLEKNQQEQHQ